MEKRYFIAKVASIDALQRSLETNQWACRDRDMPPHPRHILSEALEVGVVTLIFSVNNCHGWHGYADMIGRPGSVKPCVTAQALDVNSFKTPGKEVNIANTRGFRTITDTNVSQDIQNVGEKDPVSQNDHYESVEINLANLGSKETVGKNATCAAKSHDQQEPIVTHTTKSHDQKQPMQTGVSQHRWHHFPIQWRTVFLKEFGQQCLSAKVIENFVSKDGSPLNKSRNWQEVDTETGSKVCSLLDGVYSELQAKLEKRIQEALSRRPTAFFSAENADAHMQNWKQIVSKVEKELGRVLLACPFGSQRYNLQIPGSDTDMFLVYQANTRDILGFDPPKQTVKNSEHEVCDYTIHEVHRYCELLKSGDHRCVETLFLNPATIVHSTPEFNLLVEQRSIFLNRDCLEKYLRDAQGSRGTKYIRRWCGDNPEKCQMAIHQEPKMCKMFYVVMRLLQNARNIAVGDPLEIYREDGSENRELLMSLRTGKGARHGGFTVQTSLDLICRLEGDIESHKHNVPDTSTQVKDCLTKWLLDLRFNNFRSHQNIADWYL